MGVLLEELPKLAALPTQVTLTLASRFSSWSSERAVCRITAALGGRDGIGGAQLLHRSGQVVDVWSHEGADYRPMVRSMLGDAMPLQFVGPVALLWICCD